MIITPKSLQKFAITSAIVLVIVIAMSWWELTSRAQDQLDTARGKLITAEQLIAKKELDQAFFISSEAFWASDTIEQLLTSGTRENITPDQLETGMLLADPVYPDGLRLTEYNRLDPTKVVVESYIPLTTDDISRIRAIKSLTQLKINKRFSFTQSSNLIVLAKKLRKDSWQVMQACRPAFLKK